MCRVSFLHSSHVAKQYIDSIWDQETNCMHTLMMIIATETSPKDARGRGRETIMQHIVASSVWNCMGINSEEKLCYKMCWGVKWQSEFIHNVAQKYMYRPCIGYSYYSVDLAHSHTFHSSRFDHLQYVFANKRNQKLKSLGMMISWTLIVMQTLK